MSTWVDGDAVYFNGEDRDWGGVQVWGGRAGSRVVQEFQLGHVNLELPTGHFSRNGQ